MQQAPPIGAVATCEPGPAGQATEPQLAAGKRVPSAEQGGGGAAQVPELNVYTPFTHVKSPKPEFGASARAVAVAPFSAAATGPVQFSAPSVQLTDPATQSPTLAPVQIPEIKLNTAPVHENWATPNSGASAPTDTRSPSTVAAAVPVQFSVPWLQATGPAGQPGGLQVLDAALNTNAPAVQENNPSPNWGKVAVTPATPPSTVPVAVPEQVLGPTVQLTGAAGQSKAAGAAQVPDAYVKTPALQLNTAPPI